MTVNGRRVIGNIGRIFKHADDVKACYPVKQHPGAVAKVNISLVDLGNTLLGMGHARRLSGIVALTAGKISEDQMVNLLIYGFALSASLGDLGWDIATYFVLNPSIAKNVSVSLKALGGNASRIGAALVEADVLQGRAVTGLDLRAEALYRCDSTTVAEKVIPYHHTIRDHIRAVIEHELAGRGAALDDLDDWWSARWLWCVNGSQTRKSSHTLGLDHDAYQSTHTRVYRRMAAESLINEPVTSWNGVTSVSQSVKLENGKQRAIFACDTNSYFAFSWILSCVEKAWRNDRVILDPGTGGHIGITHRIRNAQRGGGVNLMLDYDDFNSHHATRSMQAVFEITCDVVGAPEWYRDVLSRSFDSMFMCIDGAEHRVLGTLMSGHRGTTYINSVLNAAYIRASLGGSVYDSMLSLHAGDDVYIRANTLTDCERVLSATARFGCRMNPQKQSIGYEGAEFLRIAMGRDGAYGYLTRGISGLVSGNWVTDAVLGVQDAIVSAVASTRTLINRSGCKALPRLLAGSLRYTRGLKKSRLARLLAGTAALEGAPVYDAGPRIDIARIHSVTVSDVPRDSGWSSHASAAYLSSHAAPVEREAIGLVGSDALTLLVASSYSKGLNQDVKGSLPTPNVSWRRGVVRGGFISATALLSVRAEVGVLTPYPLIHLFSNRLDDAALRVLVGMAGGDSNAIDIREEAFGPIAETKNIIGSLPYGDAASATAPGRFSSVYTWSQEKQVSSTVSWHCSS